MTTPGEIAAPVETSAPPDWATVTQDILCPLCDYNLRGLVEPRCPECGHRTNWTDLFDPNRGDHRWLFEHDRGKRIRTFFRTLWESQFAHSFWRMVRPTHVPRPRRLVVYWVIIVGIVASAPLAFSMYLAGQTYYAVYQQRQRISSALAGASVSPPLTPYERAVIVNARRVGVQQFWDQYMNYPQPGSAVLQSSRYTYGWNRYGDMMAVLLTVVIGYALWPWLTVMALLIFRQTMRQAKLHPVHVVRCAIYSADVGIMLAMFVAPILMWRTADTDPSGNIMLYAGRLFDQISLITLLVCVAILTYRLSVAYRQYLGFPMAAATCILAQCIVAMTLFGLYLWFPLA